MTSAWSGPWQLRRRHLCSRKEMSAPAPCWHFSAWRGGICILHATRSDAFMHNETGASFSWEAKEGACWEKSPSVIPEQEALAPTGNLLEIQILGPPKTQNSWGGVLPALQVTAGMLDFEKHCCTSDKPNGLFDSPGNGLILATTLKIQFTKQFRVWFSAKKPSAKCQQWDTDLSSTQSKALP